MSQPQRPFNIMAKPVSGVCNLDCRYCYYTAKPRELYPEVVRPLMSTETLELYTRQYLQAMPTGCVFSWQGGEPMLAGLEFYRRALELQEQLKAPGQIVTNAFQTNGTLLDDEWCRFLAEKSFLVGLSLDGPPQWHDSFRRDFADEPTFGRSWAGLENLARHGVEFNVLVTLNSANVPHGGDIYRYFTNRGIRYLQFIPVLERDADGRPTDYSCTSEQFGRFMIELYDIWSARDVGRVSERLIDNVLHTLIHGQAALCCYARRCADSHVLEFNGDLYACDHFVCRQWKIGNIHQRPLEELVRDERLEEFAAMKTQLPAACESCEFLRFCNGGCPKHHAPMGTDPQRVNHFCDGYKAFLRHALGELTVTAEYFKRGQVPPPKQGSAPRVPAAPQGAAATAPGRNDPCPCGSGRKYKACCGRAK